MNLYFQFLLLIPLGKRHLCLLLVEYTAHFHTERNHQGLGNRLIDPITANTNAGEERVQRHERLGGMLSGYYMRAA